MKAQDEEESRHYDRAVMFKTVGRCSFWRRPERGETGVVEDLMSKRLLSIFPCVHMGMVSLEQYLFAFTLFHLVVIVAALILNPSEGSPLDTFKDYCMFPLGVVLGEKLMLVFTGFTQWWHEWDQARRKPRMCGCLPGGICLAILGLVVNILDFLMVFYSIFDDCFEKTDGLFNDEQQFMFTMLMSIVDVVFDFFTLYSSTGGLARCFPGHSDAADSDDSECSGYDSKDESDDGL